ncbi:unnamed protein product [Dracunculus medinensis]|uniref:NDT80 domain-containing protein n=1 Tax=Dracunculus medinensis TaxID=318479 RepID=A0A3P7PPN0_DRAME|nr:unnamed protein product [Dracunculus medinensis]
MYSDPLSDCCLSGDFNILQFLEENDATVDSTLESIRQSAQNNQHCNVIAAGMMYQNPARLPDSPPITDISGAGSSGSPSSTVESPYSPPETYQNYQMVHSNQNGSSGLILGVHPEIPGHMLIPQEMLHQNNANSNNNNGNSNNSNRVLQHTLPSPQPDYIGSYQPQSSQATAISQVSPPSVNIRQVANSYIVQNNGYHHVDPYSNIINSTTNDANLGPQTSDQPFSRKRLRTDPSPHPPTPHIKNEPQKIYTLPNQLTVVPSPVTTDDFEDAFHQQAIKFSRFNEDHWATLYDINQRPLHQLEMHVVADKGFNYSTMDNCFVNQKKNHFQISVHIEAIDNHPPNYVKIGNELRVISEFKLAFCGVKSEMPSSEIQIKQSTTDRRPVPHDPVSLEIHERRMTKVTVPRLHFSETTMNNQRKNGRPNPDQKFFLLVVRLIACSTDGHEAIVQAYQSEKVIVRASNPGQFEPPDSDATWQKNGSTLYYNNGSVAIGTDRALAPLTVGGDIYCSGVVHRPSDRRIKEAIHEVDTKDAMSRLSQIRVVGYSYKPEIAVQWGLSEENRHRVGVIAQELAEILPDAVTDNGDFLQVDDSRIFYETVAAATELCRLTGNLEHKIEAVEKLSHKLAKLHRRKFKDVGSLASGLSEFGIGDKSFMSSRTSLESSAPSCISRDKKCYRSDRERSGQRNLHCKNPACQQYDSFLCNSKFTHATILSLVVVMAVCLIAMSTLYVLDWHHRTFGYMNNFQLTSETPQPEQKIGNIVQVNHGHWIPPIQPNAPPITVNCDLSSCHTYCCTDADEFYAANEYHKGIVNTNFNLPIYQSGLIPRLPIKTMPTAIQSPLASGVNIEVLTVNNFTIDERYCIEDSCKPRRGLYTLYVPVSPLMPTVPLEIKINTADDKSYVDSCGTLRDFAHKACTLYHHSTRFDPNKISNSRKITDDIFEISVGDFMQSAYRFRIGYSTESCSMSESQRGRSFDEYNIVFYRQCQKSE